MQGHFADFSLTSILRKYDHPARQDLSLRSFHVNDPSSRWVYVTDDLDEKNEVYGCAHWNFHKDESPYKDGAPTLLADWFPGRGRGGREGLCDETFESSVQIQANEIVEPSCSLVPFFS